MKPSTIYRYEPISTTKELWNLRGHVDEIDIYELEVSKNERIELKYYASENPTGDEDYWWEFFSVWYEGSPVMICNSYGEYNKLEYITNRERYKTMVEYLESLKPEEEKPEFDVYDENEDIEGLTEYENYDLSEFYNTEFKPKYKEGDIVRALVMENHIRDRYAFEDTKYIETRCKIVRVNPLNPTNTYGLLQLDRRWETQEEKDARGCTTLLGEIVEERDAGYHLFAHGSEDMIIGYWKD